jgi:hypothetical protein
VPVTINRVVPDFINCTLSVHVYSSSSSFCEAGGIPPSELQPFVAYCAKHRFSSPVHLQRRERPLLAKGGSMGEKWPVKFSLTNANSTSL